MPSVHGSVSRLLDLRPNRAPLPNRGRILSAEDSARSGQANRGGRNVPLERGRRKRDDPAWWRDRKRPDRFDVP